MSAEALLWAWGQNIKSNQKVLLLLLADAASFDGLVSGSRQVELGKKLFCSDRTIRNRLNALRDDGLLTRLPCYTAGGKGRAADMILLHLPQFEAVLEAMAEGIPEGSSKGIPESFDRGIPEKNETPENGSESQNVSIPESFDQKSTNISSVPSNKPVTRTQEDISAIASAVPLPKVTIDKLTLNRQEWEAALQIIRTFNDAAGTKFRLIGSRGNRPTEHLKRIVGRLREHPEVTLAEHQAMIKRCCSDPWWKGPTTTIGVIYGPKAFPMCLATDGRPTHGRTFANERRTSPEDAPW